MNALFRWLVGAALVTALWTNAVPAFAHDVFVGSTPENGSAVARSPRMVRVSFAEPVQDGDNQIAVVGPDGHTQWQRQRQARVDGDSVSVPLGELGPAGKYTISYRIVSADGHPVSGTATFTLTRPEHGTPAATGGESGRGTGVPAWTWLLAAVVVLVGGTWWALRLARPANR